MSRRNILLPVAKIVRRYGEGESTPALGRAYGVDGKTIWCRLVAAGVKLRPRGGQWKTIPFSGDGIADRYAGGETTTALAEAYGVDPSVVTRCIREAGVPMRAGGWPKKQGGPLHDSQGYLGSYDRDGRRCLIHRARYEAHHGPILEGHVVHHINGDTHDNRINNLECMESFAHLQMHRWSETRRRR